MYTLHYGHLAIKDLWAELKLPEFIGKLQQDSTDITSWQLSDFIFYYGKLASPALDHTFGTNRPLAEC